MKACSSTRTRKPYITRRMPQDGKEREPSKNEPNQNPGFPKNPNPVKNRTELKPKCHGCYSVLSLNEIVGTLAHFRVNEGILLYLD